MKKSILVLAVAAMCAFSFSACDELGDLDLVGHINLTATNPTGGEQAYADSTELAFKSAMSNVNIDSVYIDAGEYAGTYDLHAGTVMVGTTQTLISNDVANITFPLCGINLRDTVVGTYTISCPVDDFGFFEYLNAADVNTLITTGLEIGGELGNLFAVAVSEDAFYIGYSGSINISAYGRNELSRVEGTVNNVDAIYVTVSQLEALMNMPASERPSDLAAYFPHITFNGAISSMRADISTVIDALNENSSK
ncbi:MAG: hypothetical protein IJ524_09565 [Bacteroidales bacterium]|nr:hypothetical protein [Bacteroidales bacterium]